MLIWQAVVLAVIEGLSEFLPVSSTGHLIIASSVLGISHQELTKLFMICIQFGAILSVVVIYRRRFFQSAGFYLKLLIAFLPAAVVGKLFHHRIELFLENVLVVAVALLVGGVILLFIDDWILRVFGVQKDKEKGEEVSYRTAFRVGCFQTLAMVPGVSRSAATIIGGLTQNLTRKAAAEFSFFLAVPTMFAAAVYQLYGFYRQGGLIGGGGREAVGVLLIGNLVAFGVAWLAIKSFVAYLSRHGFRVFGYYRIVLGLLLIGLHFSGVSIRFF